MKSHADVADRRDWKPAENLAPAAALLQDASRILVFVMEGPDGDAIGSSLGLALGLRELGKSVDLVCTGGVPRSFTFLPGAETILLAVPAGARYQVTVVCDVGAFKRVGPGFPARDVSGALLNLDHHLTTDAFGDVNLVDPAAASVGVIVRRLLGALGQPLTRDIGVSLYTSILTDTGSFRYASTDAEALRVAAELLEAGVDPWEVSSAIYERQPKERLTLLCKVLGTLELRAGGKLATLVLEKRMFAETGADAEMTDGFINFARAIDGVEVAALYSEQDDGSWHVSFRSRGKVDVSRVAQQFGGGGHKNAAAGEPKGDLREAMATVEAAVVKTLGG